MAESRRNNRTDSTGNVVILETAAQCFMEQGFATTSIDDVARRMGSTKGRIYHYYSSKTDLFSTCIAKVWIGCSRLSNRS